MTTRWTVMGDAGDLSRRDAAWEHFCRAYWYPLYSFIRRRGDSPDDASDLTQAFFGKLIEQDWLARVGRRETRFSTLLKGHGNLLRDVTADGSKLVLNNNGTGHFIVVSKQEPSFVAIEHKGTLVSTISPGGSWLITSSYLENDGFTELRRLIPPSHAGWLGECHLVFDADASHLLVHTALGCVMRWNLKQLEHELTMLGMKR